MNKRRVKKAAAKALAQRPITLAEIDAVCKKELSVIANTLQKLEEAWR